MPTEPQTHTPVGPFHLDLDAIDWVDERALGKAPIELIEEAERLGAKRKRLATGECGFYATYNVMPAGYRIATHSHGHAEFITVLAGGAVVDTPDADAAEIVLDTGDAIVLEADFEYGITCGPEGMTFLTLRTGDSTTSLRD